jgi:hypothetical protein
MVIEQLAVDCGSVTHTDTHLYFFTAGAATESPEEVEVRVMKGRLALSHLASLPDLRRMLMARGT